MRCSCMVWVATGTMLELGARIRKNQAPRKPHTRWRTSAQAVAPNTVSTYRARILEKTGTKNDVELALYAERHGKGG